MFFDIAVLRFFIRKRNKIEEGGEKNEIVILLYSVIIFSCLFLPGVFYLFEFNRLYRSIFIIKYILAAYISANLKREYRNGLWVYVKIITLIFGYYYHMQLNYDSILFQQGH